MPTTLIKTTLKLHPRRVRVPRLKGGGFTFLEFYPVVNLIEFGWWGKLPFGERECSTPRVEYLHVPLQ